MRRLAGRRPAPRSRGGPAGLRDSRLRPVHRRCRLTPGQFGTVNLTVTSQNGFSEAVNLSCSGDPLASSCNFNPVVVTPPANGSSISAMQITTTAESGVGSNQARLGGPGKVFAVVIPGLLALMGAGAIGRKNLGTLRALGLVMLLAAGTLGLSSCNSAVQVPALPALAELWDGCGELHRGRLRPIPRMARRSRMRLRPMRAARARFVWL